MAKTQDGNTESMKMEKTVYEGSGAMFEEDIKVEESIKKEVEIINKKLENNLNGGVEAGVENIDDVKDDIKESKVAPNEAYIFYEKPLKSPPSFIEKLERDAMDTNEAKIKIKSEEKTKSLIDRCNSSLSSQREDLKRFEDRGKDDVVSDSVHKARPLC